jgi:phosphatidylglycerol:prolipoprotein diacylglycerol transferase
MFPELFKISSLNITLNTYGVFLVVAVTIGLWVAAQMAGRDGLDKSRIYDLGLWTLVVALISAKLLLVINEWDNFTHDPRQFLLLNLFRSGGVFYGGFIAAFITAVTLTRAYRLPRWRTADASALGIAMGQAIGRLGCFSAGCCWGEPTTSAWGVQFTKRGHEITGVPTVVSHLNDPAQRALWANQPGGLDAPLHLHPTQLYETVATLIIFVALLWLSRRRRFEGQVMLAYVALYAVARFIIEFWRDDPRGSWLGLSTSQLIAVILLLGVTCIGAIRTHLFRRDKKTSAVFSTGSRLSE